MAENVKFVRVRGRVIPIKQKKENEVISVKKSALIGAGGGIAHGVYTEAKANAAEAMVKNSRSLRDFKKKLAPGDILIMGSTSKHSGGIVLGDIVADYAPKKMQKPILKAAKKIGLRKNTTLLSNSTLLNAIGGGKKYHAGIWDGKRVIHMSTDAGAVSEKLSMAIEKQNVSALRFKNVGSQEIKSAVSFAQNAVKNQTKYQNFTEYSKNAISSLLFPLSKKASQCKGKLVCHTLPIRSYHKRNFSFRGEYTLAGEFRKTKDLLTIAKRDIVRSPALTFKGYGGAVAKGLKFAIPAAMVAWGINKLVGRSEK